MVKNLRKPTFKENKSAQHSSKAVPKYKMPRKVKQRIKGLIAVATLSLGSIPVIANAPIETEPISLTQEPATIEKNA